ncbi:hypothetical protein QNA08_07230 [Chelatococcus sp. SYSU_G07232]|uniref:MFS transporter n=1 Tax=Chelatococcus albus TaxID=3047466 RepID=A0ABT7AF78_9HYPH|nr:hypothetical protein [Chelatococcus sp. SYSU_G07232]MDJ1158024.1 hypothetical protein [Chelatococcus sp. SYSU_G07232]
MAADRDMGVRAGRLACLCPPGAAGQRSAPAAPAEVATLAAGFALAVLSQVLTLGMLPLAGLLIAPEPSRATWPYAAMLVGSALASFPASFLLDAFGRRAALALGASLGAAGGAIAAWGLAHGQFPALVLGAFWLGIANGFGLFYRHVAAAGGARGGRGAVAGVIGAGALVGFVAPVLAGFAEGLAATRLFVGTALLAALAHVAGLLLTVVRPVPTVTLVAAQPPVRTGWRGALLPTGIGVVAWFVMTLLMAAGPLAMAGCGLGGSAAMGSIAWHVVAMYAPALLVARLPDSVEAETIALAGLALLLGAAALFAGAATEAMFNIALLLLGAGWSLATLATTLWLHRDGTPSRLVLAGHDAALFIGAIGGALAAGPVFAGQV